MQVARNAIRTSRRITANAARRVYPHYRWTRPLWQALSERLSWTSRVQAAQNAIRTGRQTAANAARRVCYRYPMLLRQAQRKRSLDHLFWREPTIRVRTIPKAAISVR